MSTSRIDPIPESDSDLEAMRDAAQGDFESRVEVVCPGDGIVREERTILWIGGWYSQCGACGHNADPNEKAHDNLTMRGDGCGATFTHTSSKELGITAIHLHNMRPDLPVRP